MTKQELMQILKDFSIEAVSKSNGSYEPLERATFYVANRIEEGLVRDTQELKAVWAAFADGFCTGRGHRS